jgi:hypothetical protein
MRTERGKARGTAQEAVTCSSFKPFFGLGQCVWHKDQSGILSISLPLLPTYFLSFAHFFTLLMQDVTTRPHNASSQLDDLYQHLDSFIDELESDALPVHPKV